MQEGRSTQDNSVQFTSYSSKSRTKYGNMVVLSDCFCLLSIGPDYCCFFTSFLMFLAASVGITCFVLANSSNRFFIYTTFFISAAMCLSYLAVALCNPGITLDSSSTDDELELLSDEERNPKVHFCRRCQIKVKRGTRHCRECDVCVEGYDHHCPWTSKCIGKGNIIQFYLFLGMVPTFLIYIFLAFVMVISGGEEGSKRHIKTI